MNPITIYKNLVYTKIDGEALTCDVYLPANRENIPCVLLLHGGGFKFGTSEAYQEWGTFLASHGIGAMAVNYRLSNGRCAGYPGAVSDVNDALTFLLTKAQEWKLDPYNLGFMGDSSGACLAFLTTFRRDYASLKIRLIVGAYGVYDMVAWGRHCETKWPKTPNAVTCFMGTTAEKAPDLYREASPLYMIAQACQDLPLVRPEVFLVWGEQDGFVPCSEHSLPFAQKLRQLHFSVETLAIPDAAHLWFPRDIVNNEICPMDLYPHSVVAPRVLDFLQRIFFRPRFSMPDGELTCIAKARKKMGKEG